MEIYLAIYLIITCLIILFTSQIIYCCFIRYLIYRTIDIQESSLQIHREFRKTIVLQDRDIVKLEDNLENLLEDLPPIIQRIQNSNRSLPPLPSVSTSVQTSTLTSVYCDTTSLPDTPDTESPPLTLTEPRRRTAEPERAEETPAVQVVEESESETESESESESEDSEEQEEDETVDLNTSRVERRREKKKRRLRSYMFNF